MPEANARRGAVTFKDHFVSHSALHSAHLRIDGISKTYPDRRVFTDISFAVPYHDRVGIIGENGSGKTTLLRIIAAEVAPDAGTIQTFAARQSHLAVGLLHQEPPFSHSISITDAVEVSVRHLRQAAADVDTAAQTLAETPEDPSALTRYTEALETAQRLQVWQTDSLIDSTIAGLGLDGIDRTRPIGQLSGGQRSRLAMACLLLSAPEVLLLDEPTNHLDDSATRYLTSVLTTWRGPVLIVSHDRAFLDETVTSILDLDPAPRPHANLDVEDAPTTTGVTRFSGTYSEYLHAKDQARQRWQQQYDQEQAQLQRLRAAVNDNQVVGHRDWKPRTEIRMAQKYYADRNAKVVARRVNDARSRLDELTQRQIARPPKQLHFQGLGAATPTRHRQLNYHAPLLTADHVGITDRLEPVSLTISTGDKILVTGANGTGKSTLLSLLAGELAPSQGTVHRADALHVGMLTQETGFDDFEGQSAQGVYEHRVGAQRAQATPLSTFGLLTPRDETRDVVALSVGQQRRLALAVLLAAPPDVLLLDEPTNHLSLQLVTELEASIVRHPGAVVIATHDRWLRRRWQGRCLHLER